MGDGMLGNIGIVLRVGFNKGPDVDNGRTNEKRLCKPGRPAGQGERKHSAKREILRFLAWSGS